MLLPRLFVDDFFDDAVEDWMPTRSNMFGKHEKNWMKTDIKDVGDAYELDMDLPGFKKEDVQIELENGYLSISASKNHEVSNEDEKSSYIRKERYYGSCSRSFYVGEEVSHEDIKARFEDGILRLNIPKMEQKQVENKKFISIE